MYGWRALCLVCMIGTCTADLLSMTTEITTSETQCTIKSNTQITDITIDPVTLLQQLRNELYTVRALKASVKRDKSVDRKWPMQIGQIKIHNITTEQMIIQTLDAMPAQIQSMIIDQHKIINLMTQSIYTTTDIRYKTANENTETNELLAQIPKITKTFLTQTSFDQQFIACQKLDLDHTIQNTRIKMNYSTSHQIISNNREMLATQYEIVFEKEWPQELRIGFSQTSSEL